MQIFVRPPSGGTITVDVEPEQTGLQLKRLLWWRLGIPVELMWISAGARVLNDDTTLAAAGVFRESTVHCFVRFGVPENRSME
jgi:hypothetical protein